MSDVDIEMIELDRTAIYIANTNLVIENPSYDATVHAINNLLKKRQEVASHYFMLKGDEELRGVLLTLKEYNKEIKKLLYL